MASLSCRSLLYASRTGPGAIRPRLPGAGGRAKACCQPGDYAHGQPDQWLDSDTASISDLDRATGRIRSSRIDGVGVCRRFLAATSIFRIAVQSLQPLETSRAVIHTCVPFRAHQLSRALAEIARPNRLRIG